MLLTNFPTTQSDRLAYLKPNSTRTWRLAYLMAGGDPAGINIPTPDLGCRTNNTKIKTTTMQGNNNTTPRGIEMLEFPFSLSGRRKKASRELVFALVFTSSMDGRFGDVEGMRFSTL